MVNLFRPVPTEQGSLTAALLALLEHCDRDLLNGLLRTAGIPFQAEAGAEVEMTFPAPGGPPSAGWIATRHFRITIITQAPGEMLWPVGEGSGTVLAVTLAGKAKPGTHVLSWEQLDRWLGSLEERYDVETRTGFLIRQFRTFLPEMGIEYFAGFTRDQLTGAPGALGSLSEFYQVADSFFDRFGPALAAVYEGAAQARDSRPEDLLAGYCYRDYAGPSFTPAAFLRIAFHLPEQQFQLSFWVAPGTEQHGRLREGVLGDTDLVAQLAGLEEEPLLWLWSTGGEQKLPLEDWQPGRLEALDWSQYQAGIQRSRPFEDLSGEGLVERVIQMAEGLCGALLPVLTTVLH